MSAGLRRFRDPKPVVRAGERCEMCAVPVAEAHQHVVNVESREIMCTCRPCFLLFTHTGAALAPDSGGPVSGSGPGSRGRYRAVPERYRYDPDFAIADATWESAGIPVSMAFLFRNSARDEAVAFYPSPAGATESMLGGDAWSALLTGNPAVSDIEPDVEALLINRRDPRGRGAEGDHALDTGHGFEAFLVPIDVCYELVGLVRLNWKGFDGGTRAWTAINEFFSALRARSETVGAARG